ncbi:MAG: 3-methyl-2-oxobutanoate hydroxymethyltransferase [Hydrogenophilales bacterium CG03_land_8_20_14_0_80_62_28]|nr:3-methyl-2-oxobutanoate hydroxymethyltransferase [Betaproteobacteria bacterium]OIO79320.1 MAG: 3-methyl-2-oxobutanoate hydroxymethyltransferase [Hydrogenophilaceae bacterium CG1_02_62_390]PIV24242.1 MAG: 3-methyl-2-oxobutanoate hydroxymethyltransferase [Hydrogenophilales bacterium CG03_land_8_20_14_0_80_62_28]PIW39040.1 MAG: 3-methyl-2-oxobutanoate hydroxymethyltransferase [Hydrogenophilales bacterium CG15_BIG_FIL_POST_REV_8_21_14_020_62_31]PIW71449.1 MAG: 3-methyl-2-oxobutanoate hydroxymeth
MFMPQLMKKAEAGEKLAALTCYDASYARILVQAGVDILLVGDSLGMTVQGHDTTLPVSLEQMVYHSAAVRRGAGNAFILVDLPFGSYQQSPGQAFASAAQLLVAGANMVKLEGGAIMVETVEFLVRRGVPVCAHLGLLPQSVNRTGYRAQARDNQAALQLLEDAANLEQAGAELLVLESIPALLASEVTSSLRIPTIGIGAGPQCDGQVLVLNDILGLTEKPPRFAHNFMLGATAIEEAVRRYVTAVKAGEFPAAEHAF